MAVVVAAAVDRAATDQAEVDPVMVDPVTADVLRQHNFDNGLALDANFTVNFFPWGMADATVMTLTNPSGAAQIDVLPTGMVEVH